MRVKNFIIASCLLGTITLQSCIKEKDLYQAPPTTYSELNLKLEGDYIINELPMARAASSSAIDESKAILGIAISMTPLEGQNTTSKPYAYGIFQLSEAKKPDNLKIRVIDGYTYRISCSMIADAKDSIRSENNTFETPFDIERSGTKGECLNKFVVAEQPTGVKFLYNIENPKVKTKGGQDACDHPFIERYHGLIDKITVKEGMVNTLKLYRRFFGVKFKQTGLERGRLKIKIEGSPEIYIEANTKDIHATMESKLKMVSMKNLTSSIPENNQYLTEGIKVEVFWEEVPGESNPKNIVTTNMSFKRNYIHTITLTNIEHIGTPGNVGIEIESGEMQEEPGQDIPWQ